MAKKLKLTAMNDGRWRKVYKGQLLYFPKGDYKTALMAWEARKVRIDQARQDALENIPEVAKYQAMAEWSTDHGQATEATGYKAMATAVKGMVAKGEPIPSFSRPLKGISEAGKAIWADRLQNQKQAKATTKNLLSVAIDSFLKRQLQKHNAGKMSAGRYSDLVGQMKRFQTVMGTTASVDDINSRTLETFHGWLLERIAEGISAATARYWFVGVRQFIKWAYSNEYLDKMPRNFDDNELQISIPAPKIETFSVDEFHKLCEGTSEKTILYFLLMLNCGFTQVDVSDLKQTEVDWNLGKITRKRSKTSKRQNNVPEVTFKLFPTTFKLLKKFRSNQENVLVGDSGMTIKMEVLKDGKLCRSDAIRCAYGRVCKRLGIPCRQLKLFRKTGATALGNNPDFAAVAQLWLGQSPDSIAKKHYIKPGSLDAAIDWLGQEFKVATIL